MEIVAHYWQAMWQKAITLSNLNSTTQHKNHTTRISDQKHQQDALLINAKLHSTRRSTSYTPWYFSWAVFLHRVVKLDEWHVIPGVQAPGVYVHRPLCKQLSYHFAVLEHITSPRCCFVSPQSRVDTLLFPYAFWLLAFHGNRTDNSVGSMADVPKDLLQQIKELERQFTVPKEKLKEITNHFVSELNKGELLKNVRWDLC